MSVKWTCPVCVRLGAFDKTTTVDTPDVVLEEHPEDWTPACPRCSGSMEIS